MVHPIISTMIVLLARQTDHTLVTMCAVSPRCLLAAAKIDV
jgi:hypothetical protein